MHKMGIAKAVVALVMAGSLCACGGGDGLGGNVTEFKTATATAVAATPRLEADLITGNTCTGPGLAGVVGGTIVTESVDFTINTKAATANPLPLTITGWTVSFTPKNPGTPALTPLTSNFSVPINAGSSVTIPVAITTELQKIDIITADPTFPCSVTVNQYDVTVRFHAVEVGSDDGSKDIVAGLVLAMADRNN